MPLGWTNGVRSADWQTGQVGCGGKRCLTAVDSKPHWRRARPAVKPNDLYLHGFFSGSWPDAASARGFALEE
jgi:hypothetical protein